MASFIKEDNYGNIFHVFLGPCMCECGIELSNDECHTHENTDPHEEERTYVKNYMRKWRHDNK